MKTFFTGILLFCAIGLLAQQDLLNELSDSGEPEFTIATFKGSRVVNGHSVEARPEGTLEFLISHRFGTLNSGGYELWGLDVSTIRLGLEYGLTNRLGVGIGRSSFDKSYDGYLKYKILRQGKGQGTFPVTVTGLGSVVFNNSMTHDDELAASEAMAYVGQLLIARKFHRRFSLQVSPSIVHRNTVDQDVEVNTLFVLGIATRVMVTRSFSINAEYFARLNEHSANPNYDAIGLAFEIETGGHVFQLIFTNAVGMMERKALAETTDDFFEGAIHFGFNITRTFQLKRKI